jgi:hypothetical protein
MKYLLDRHKGKYKLRILLPFFYYSFSYLIIQHPKIHYYNHVVEIYQALIFNGIVNYTKFVLSRDRKS